MRTNLDSGDLVIGSGVLISVLAVSDFFEVGGESWCIIDGVVKIGTQERDVSIPCKTETISRMLSTLTPESRLDKINKEEGKSGNTESPVPSSSPYLSRTETAEYLGVSISSITNLVKRGHLTPIQQEGIRGFVFKKEEVESLKERGVIKPRRKRTEEV